MINIRGGAGTHPQIKTFLCDRDQYFHSPKCFACLNYTPGVHELPAGLYADCVRSDQRVLMETWEM
jgi:hypothetical protein